MYKGYIYRHWLINDKGQEKSYIGQTIESNIENRWGKNGEGYIKDNKDRKKMARAIKKYGWNAFNHKVLFSMECETEEELWFWLDQWEIYYIEKYDSYYNGYNSTLGGCGTRGYKHTDETKKELSKKLKGRPSPQKGKKASDETKQKLSKSHKEYYKTEQGTKWCQQRSERMSGSSNPFHGQTHKDETRKILSEKAKQRTGSKSPSGKKTICLETKQVFDTAKKASEWCHGNVKNNIYGITSYAGKHPITGAKLHWMYYEDYLKLQEEQQNNDNLDSKIA